MLRTIRTMTRKLVPILLLVVLLAACGGGGAAPAPNGGAAGERLVVLATTQQIADAVQNVAGDTVELTTLLGPGIDPHTYVPTESDIRTFENADVIFYNGLNLEAQIERVLAQLANDPNRTVVGLANQLDPAVLLAWEPEAGLPNDPHVWNDVRLWQAVVTDIAATLAATDPANAATYEANAASYNAELDELHEYIIASVERIPAEQRVLVTAHDAFAYLGQAYGLTVEAVQGISTESEAATADIQQLAQIIVERNVPAIFIETTISPRTIEAVQEAVRAESGREVLIGGELYSDAMGAPGSGAETYIGMMRHNIDTISGALSGTARTQQ